MSRSRLISKEEALAACEKLTAAGKTITSVAVRAELGGGTGSYTMITAAIKDFKNKQADPNNPAASSNTSVVSTSLSEKGIIQQLWPVNPPPVSFAEKGTGFIHQLWQEAQSITQQQLEAAQVSFNFAFEAQNQELRSQSNDLNETFGQLQKFETLVEELRADLKTTQDESAKKDKELHSARESLFAREIELKAIRDQLDSIKKESQRRVGEITTIQKSLSEASARESENVVHLKKTGTG